ncbi:MAG TPA: MFS transporter [Dehalococcoidia bacterium]|nr:MFS transporter [Dehalococcoidia bacterium]
MATVTPVEPNDEAIKRREMMMRSGPRGGGMGGADASSLLTVHKTFSALKIPAYQLLWLSMLGSFAGMQMQMVARGVLAYEIGGTNSAIAVVSLGWGIPMLLFSLVGGTLADRINRRRLMMLSQLMTASVALTVAVLVHTGMIEIWHLFVAGLAQGVVFSFSGPARQAFIPEVVGEKELMNAIALNQAGMNLTRVAGPFVAGALIAVPWIDIEGVFFIQAALNVCALLLILAIPLVRAAPEVEAEKREREARGQFGPMYGGPRGTMVQDLVDGLRYVIASPILLTLLVMGLVPALIGMSYQSFLPVFAKDVFGDGVHRNAEGLGLMMTVSGIGALAGSLVMASMADFPRRTQLQLYSGLGFGIFLAGFALMGNYVGALLALAMLGFMSSYFQGLNSTMVMTASDAQFYGRVMSVNMMTFSLMPLGTLPMGFIADSIGSLSLGPIDLIGIQAAQFGAGVILTLFILAVTVFNPAYRQLEQDDFKRFALVAVERVQEGRGEGSIWSQLRRSMKHERGSTLARKYSDMPTEVDSATGGGSG